MSAEKIAAQSRTEFGKGAARRLRAAKQIPAVVYGHGQEPAHLALPYHPTMMALKKLGLNALLELDIDGTEQLVLTKDVQVDPIRRVIEHVDFVAVVRGERVTVEVPVVTVGAAVSGTNVVTDSTAVQIEADALNLPESIEVSIEGLDAGAQITAGDLELPKGVTLVSDAELLLVKVDAAEAQDLGEVVETAEADAAE